MIVFPHHPHGDPITIKGHVVTPGSNGSYQVTSQQLNGIDLRTLPDGTILTVRMKKHPPGTIEGNTIREIEVQSPGVLTVIFSYDFDPGDWDSALSLGVYEAILFTQQIQRFQVDDDLLPIRSFVKDGRVYLENSYWPNSFTLPDIEAEVANVMGSILQPVKDFRDQVDAQARRQFSADVFLGGRFRSWEDRDLWRQLSKR